MRPSPPSSRRSNLNANPDLLARMHPSDAILAADLRRSASTQARQIGEARNPSVDAPFQARENVGIVVARGRMLSSVRPSMRQEHSRRPVWEFADRVQITQSVLEQPRAIMRTFYVIETESSADRNSMLASGATPSARDTQPGPPT